MTRQRDDARSWLARGEELAASGESQRAVDAFRRALTLDPELGPASFGLATELLVLGRAAEALPVLEDAVARAPLDAPLIGRLGDALQLAGRREEAIAAYRRAVELDPSAGHAWYGLGCAELAAGAHAAAAEALRRAAALRPAAEAHFNFAVALFNLGDIERAIAEFDVVLGLDNETLRREALAAIARLVPGSPGADNAEVVRRRRAWAASVRPRSPLPRRRIAPIAGRKLRVGYVSAFFRGRNWMKPVWALINNHDRSRFEIHIFSDSEASAEECAGYRDRAEDYWHMVGGAANEDLARYIAAREIDILVDLNGYSAQERLSLFMHRPAPIQAAWFGMYAPTGLDCFDLLIVDEAAFPREEDAFFAEEIVRLPGSYFTFEVGYAVPDVAPPPSTRGAPFTFGSLGSHYKLTPSVIEAWAGILRAAPEARLLVKNRFLDNPANRAFLHDRFAALGVRRERILLEGPEDHFAFLEAYSRIDVALDTFPYNGGTTTVEALWQGVPVLTFNGDRWAARTSRSVLVGACMESWVEPDLASYVARAIALANDPETPSRLATLRAGMRDWLRAAPICDTAGYCRSVEAVYREAAARRETEERPASRPV
ncbi:MAG: tetratricopeptide repeat protein [Rhodospirillales bacterium]|nr:tetratricopeptide repeat protein [Rhodospirillales bacterium]